MLTAKEAYNISLLHGCKIKQVEETIMHHAKNGDTKTTIIIPVGMDYQQLTRILVDKGYRVAGSPYDNNILVSWEPYSFQPIE